jgi:hypothetical protein
MSGGIRAARRTPEISVSAVDQTLPSLKFAAHDPTVLTPFYA